MVVEEWQYVNAQPNSQPTQVIINRGWDRKWVCVSEKVKELVCVCGVDIEGGLGERVEKWEGRVIEEEKINNRKGERRVRRKTRRERKRERGRITSPFVIKYFA